MKVSATALDRIRNSKLAPEHFVRGFAALLAAVNHTGDTGIAITIDYSDEDEHVEPDILIPIITLSFKRETNEEARQEARQENAVQENAAPVEEAPQDGGPEASGRG